MLSLDTNLGLAFVVFSVNIVILLVLAVAFLETVVVERAVSFSVARATAEVFRYTSFWRTHFLNVRDSLTY